MLCFLNIVRSHWWNFIKPCKHIHLYMTNTYNKKKIRARANSMGVISLYNSYWLLYMHSAFMGRSTPTTAFDEINPILYLHNVDILNMCMKKFGAIFFCIMFSCPCVFACHCVCVRLSVMFCFLNIMKSHWWNFIKPCKHLFIFTWLILIIN